jgi:maltose-binding protein MalE
MSKKLLWAISILLIAVFALSACQADETDPGAAETPVDQETPVEQETPMEGEPTQVETPDEELPPTGDEPVHIVLWTKEGEADLGLVYVNSLVDEYTTQNPNVTFDVVNKEVETLREDFLTASLAGNPPDLLWTVSDHAGPFTEAGLIRPVQDHFNMDQYVSSVVLGENTWGVPISSGNHLMLIFNRSLLAEAPEDTNELVEVGQDLAGESQLCLGLQPDRTLLARTMVGWFWWNCLCRRWRNAQRLIPPKW